MSDANTRSQAIAFEDVEDCRSVFFLHLIVMSEFKGGITEERIKISQNVAAEEFGSDV